MGQFSRRTILAAIDELALQSHSEMTRFALEHAMEKQLEGTSKADRANHLAAYLFAHPDDSNEYGENLNDTIVMAIVERASGLSKAGWPAIFDHQQFQARFPAIHRALARDGFTVADGTLRRTLPTDLKLPQADDEVHTRLDTFGFLVSRGHLDQAISAHARGEWASANAQFRAFIESLFDAIAEKLAQGGQLPAAGNPRRIWLASRNPPFFLPGMNEWDGQGTGFLNGFFRRLHPAGSHPGLSDEEDSTFRLHLVLLVARNLLRRL